MPSSIQEAFQKALTKTQTHVAQPIPAEWDDETTETKIEEIKTMQTPTAATTEIKRAYFQTTNNVTRETFNFVRDNPGLSRTRIVELLEARGYKKSSTTSLLGQMVKQGLVREHNNDALFVTQAEYTPLKSSTTLKNKEVRKVKAKPQPEPKAAPVEPKTKRLASTNTLLAEEFDADKFVDAMTLKQAKAVYDALRKIFG